MKHFYTLLALLLLLQSVGANAQKRVQSETQVNQQYHDIIIEHLQQDLQQRQKTIRRQADDMLQNLPWDEKLYDETFIDIKTAVEEGIDEEGKHEINFLLDISYNCNHLESITDDYALGDYHSDSSNSSRAICNISKNIIEGICSDLFKQGSHIDITIHASTDGTEIAHVDYLGEYGDLRYQPMNYNNENVRISLSQSEGITTNAQLAFARALSVRDFIDNDIANLGSTTKHYRYVTKSFRDTGSHYRRSSISMTVHGAFDDKAASMEARLRQDEFVDYNIPVAEADTRKNTFVVIIANEDYGSLPQVPFANNDGAILRQYCIKTLGIPERHVKLITNATKEAVKQQGIGWLKDITVAVKGEANIIVYYAGHGTTDADYHPYLIPVGVDFSDIKSFKKKSPSFLNADDTPIELSNREDRKVLKQCIAIDTMAAWFSRVKCKSITFLIDASFNGVQRNGMPFFDVEKNGRKGKGLRIRNDVVVFCAADYDKTAFAFDDQHHGFFTYFLLQELKSTLGDCDFGTLFDNIDRRLSYESSLQGKLQQPIVTPGGKTKDSWSSRRF